MVLTGRWQTDWFNDLRIRDWFPEFQKGNIVVVRVSVKASVANNGCHCTHNGRAFSCDRLVMIPEDDADFRAF